MAMALPVSAQVGSTDVPMALPKDIKQWEEVTSCGTMPPCILHLANADLQYDLYVDPSRPMMYAITHYHLRVHTDGARTSRPSLRTTEAVFWMDGSGHQRVFAREHARRWKTLWVVRQSRWRELNPEGGGFMERGNAFRVWSVRALMMMEGAAPEHLEF